MILWRISEWPTLNGAGGLTVGGRWHSRGRPIVYNAESSALAILEVLVHLEVDRVPPDFQLLKIEAEAGLMVEDWPFDTPLPSQADSARWGDAWLKTGRTALARVPSAIAPGSCNMLINPGHPDATRIGIAEASRWPWDKRLFAQWS